MGSVQTAMSLRRVFSSPRAAVRCSRACSSFVTNNPFEQPKTFVEIQIEDKVGALVDALQIFRKHDVSITRLESRPSADFRKTASFQGDLEGLRGSSLNIDACILELRVECMRVSFPGDRDVPWFPQYGRDLDNTSASLEELIADDHPGFSDNEYLARRNKLADQAAAYRHGDTLPRIEYSQSELDTWRAVMDKLEHLHQQHACAEYLRVRPLLEQHCGFSKENIPQLEDVSCFLQDCTGFRIRPVTGLLSARDFLNALAFRVFFSTQYIRHHSRPLYTPEPDLIHEMVGHVPLFADPDFADFSHSIGVASLGASDEDIQRLATCYW